MGTVPCVEPCAVVRGVAASSLARCCGVRLLSRLLDAQVAAAAAVVVAVAVNTLPVSCAYRIGKMCVYKLTNERQPPKHYDQIDLEVYVLFPTVTR